MATEFEIGAQYSRPDVADLIGMPEQRRGGNWHTGYDRWGDEFFIFCNVGSPGRTGHDYANRWYGTSLIWYGKTGTTVRQAQVRDLLSGHLPVHLFWRGRDRSPFTYAGLAYAQAVADTTPVEVTWELNALPMQVQAEMSGTPVWKRGPPPTVGERTIHRQDGPTSVYVMTLQGPVKAVFPDLADGMAVVKVGMSNDPRRRELELNCGFPPGCSLRWELFHRRQYPSGQAAFEAEGSMLERHRLKGQWIGGEFIYVQQAALSSLLTGSL
jgi:hypothetical protein